MLKSMTGFGSGRATLSGLEIEVEIRSVNSRFLDISWKLPGALSRFEVELSRTVRQHVRRGRIDVLVTRRPTDEVKYEVRFQKSLFEAYFNATRDALGGLGVEVEDEELVEAALQILRKPEVLELQPLSIELEFGALEAALLEAVSELGRMRSVEGGVLKEDLLHRISLLEKGVERIHPQVAASVEAYRERLLVKVKRLFASLEFDQTRFASEVALFAERSDISEELKRLESHFEQFRLAIEKNEGGKKLEFLIQEMGREVNTVGSKSQSSEISQIVVECKAELEKLREQVQNVE